MTQVFCVVEGDGEVAALPVLLRRINPEFRVGRPWLCPKDKMLRDDELRRLLENARMRTAPDDLILLLMDADDDAPCIVAPTLLGRVRTMAPDRHVRVVMAMREFEAWFLGAMPSLRGFRGIPADAAEVPAPENVRGAKETLGQLMGRPYSPTIDQPAFANAFHLEQARSNCPSFDKLLRDLGR